MKPALLIGIFIACTICGHAAIIEFDLSPQGSGPGVGLSPLNEVIPGFSAGSGNEIGAGIFFDTTTMLLTLNLGYGSAEGFTDLTTPAFSWLLHGPAIPGETAPVLFDLASMHTFAGNPGQGGRIVGVLSLSGAQTADLLSGLNYINIYTPANLGGEIRGQLMVVPEPHPGVMLLAAGVMVLFGRVVQRRRQIRLNRQLLEPL